MAKRLNVKLVDKLMLEEAAKMMKMCPNYLEKFDEKAPTIWDGFNYTGANFHATTIPLYHGKITNNDLYVAQTTVIKELSKQEPCVFVGRCANHILKDELGCISVYLYGDMPSRLRNLTEKYGITSEKNLEKEVKRIDKQRAEYYKTYTGEHWRNMNQYDICLDTSKLSVEDIAEIIYKYILKRKWIL